MGKGRDQYILRIIRILDIPAAQRVHPRGECIVEVLLGDPVAAEAPLDELFFVHRWLGSLLRRSDMRIGCTGGWGLFRFARGVGYYFTFCIAQKVTKTLVALKTRLDFPSLVWLSRLLSRLFVFHVLFLSIVVPHSVLSVDETGH